MKTNLLTAITLALLVGCENKDIASKCAKAKFVGTTCSGILLDMMEGQWVDEHWGKEIGGTDNFRTFVTASIDHSLVPDNVALGTIFTSDSVFFFQYKDGGRPTQSVCSDLAPTITILNVSESPCAVHPAE